MIFNNIPFAVYHVSCTRRFRTVVFDLSRRFARRSECFLRRCLATTRFRFLRVEVMPSIIDWNSEKPEGLNLRRVTSVVCGRRIRIGGDVETTPDCGVISLGSRTTTNDRGIYRVSGKPIQFPERARIPLPGLLHPSSHRGETPTPPRPFCAHST